MVKPIEQAELAVRKVFEQEFPGRDFNEWNGIVDDAGAQNIITAVGRATTINVKKFIEDLW